MRTSLVSVVTVGFLAGCATTSSGPPTIQTGPDAEVSVDGLHRVDNSVMALAYMKPDIDLRRYTALMIDPVDVAYQRDPQGARRATDVGARNQNFELSSSQMEDLKSWFQEAVEEALTSDGGYRIVDTPGPDVVRISAELLNLVVRIPTQASAGRSRTFASSYGEVTLVVEARDSETGEILARAADRRDPTGNSGRDLVEVSRVFVRAETQRLFQYWAEIMRDRLDELRALEIEPGR